MSTRKPGVAMLPQPPGALRWKVDPGRGLPARAARRAARAQWLCGGPPQRAQQRAETEWQWTEAVEGR